MIRPLFRRVACAALFTLAFSAPLQAQQTWTGASNFSWNDAGNWTTAVPVAADPVLFTGTASGSPITLDANQSVLGLNFTNNTGSVYTISGGAFALTLNASGITATGTAANIINSDVVLAASQTWNIGGSGSLTASRVISDGGNAFGLTKLGSGTLILNGSSVNTYTGSTTVNGGIFRISFANLATPTNLIDSSSALVVGGGRFEMIGKNSGTTAQTLNGVTGNSGTSTIFLNRNGGTSSTLTLGTVTRNPGSVISFRSNNAITNTNSSIERILVSNPVDAFLGAWAITGDPITNAARWAYVSSGQLRNQDGTVTTPNWANVTSSTTVYTSNAAATLDANRTAQGIQQNTGGAIAVNLNSFTLTANGFLNLQTGTWAFSGGTTSNITVGSENDLIFASQGSFTISVPIVNKSGDNSNVTMAGGGTLTLNTVASTYTGLTTVNGGTVQLGLANVLNSASGIVVNGGALNFTTFNQGVNSVKLTGGSITSSSGTLTSATTYDFQAGTADAILTGAVGLTKSTAGTVTLTKANTYTGNTIVSAGTLRLANASTNNIANSPTVLVGGTFANNAAALNVTGLSGGGITLAANQTLAGHGTVTGGVTAASTSTLAPGSAVAIGTLTLAAPVILDSGSTLKWKIAAGAPTTGAFNSGLSDNTGGTARDLLNITGGTNTLTASAATSTFDLTQLSGTVTLDPNTAYSFTVAATAGSPNGTGLTVSTTNAADFANYLTGNGGQNTITLDVSGGNVYLNLTPVPEPATVGLFAALGMLGLRRLRR